MKPIVFYHARCLDGFSGAWAAWKVFGSKAEYRPLTHDIARTPHPIKGRDLYFIDYCLPAELFDRVRRRALNVVVIDHHVTHRDIGARADTFVFDMHKSGCVLAWKYFHKKKKVPQFLLTIQDNDLFTLKRRKTLEIITALTLAERTFKIWDALARDFEKDAQRKKLEALGAILLQFKDVTVDRLLELACPVTFHGHRAYAVNTQAFYSDVGTRIYATMGVPLGITWYYKDGRIKVSLRSDGSVNTGALAARYGGGGHRGASGFWTDFDGTFPWTRRKVKTA